MWIGTDRYAAVAPSYVYPKADKVTSEQAAYIKGYFKDLGQAMLSNDFGRPSNGYEK